MHQNNEIKFTPTKAHKWRAVHFQPAPSDWQFDPHSNSPLYCKLLMMDIGARMRKTSKGTRDKVPEDALTLMESFSRAHINRDVRHMFDRGGIDGATSTCIDECHYCSAIDNSQWAADSADAILLKCSLCLMPHHIGYTAQIIALTIAVCV